MYGRGRITFLLDEDGYPTLLQEYRLIISVLQGRDGEIRSMTGSIWQRMATGSGVTGIGYSSKLFDIIRIDHFRAFDTYWKIPASCPTAVEGQWIEAPGYQVIDTLKEKIPDVNLVAEDLGDLRPEVLALRITII